MFGMWLNLFVSMKDLERGWLLKISYSNLKSLVLALVKPDVVPVGGSSIVFLICSILFSISAGDEQRLRLFWFTSEFKPPLTVRLLIIAACTLLVFSTGSLILFRVLGTFSWY